METISVIIPVYNTEKYVELCIQSILEQTYNNIEVIIINDNSEDSSSGIIQNIAKQNPHIKVFNNTENKGVGATRNFGIQQATGEYIYFLDSDDYLPKQTLEFLMENIGEHEFIRGRMRTTNLSTSFAIIFSGIFNLKYFNENRFNLLKHSSATNFLFKKTFIEKNNLTFSEELEVYTDLYFMLPAFNQVKTVPYVNEAIYFKRQRDDYILNPSLTQLNVEKLIPLFFRMYMELKDKYSDPEINTFLDEQLLNFYRKDIVLYIEGNYNVDQIFPSMHNVMMRLSDKQISLYDWILRREIKAIKKGDINKFKRINFRHHFLRDAYKARKSKRACFEFIYKHLFSKLSQKNKLVFFESFAGRGYSDNPKYIYEKMLETKPDYKFVWSLDEDLSIPGKSKRVKRFSLKYYYYLARSKYWVTNARMPNNIYKRKEKIYLQTWHGTPLKRLAGDMDNVLMPGTNPHTYKKNFSNETKKWDYLVSPNAYSTNIFKRAFWFNNTMLDVGYPRNDALYKLNDQPTINKLKQKMNLPSDKKILLYAPTWRDDEYYSVGNYKFTLQLDLDKLRNELSDKYIIILRMHYLIASQLELSDYEGFVYDFSSYDDISELYLVSDILMTDYSSVFFDYANLRRPILFYTYDIDKYRDQLRGFYLDIETEVPGPLVMSTPEIISSINDIGEIERVYKDRYDKFYKRFCEWDDGNAASRIIETVFKE